MKWSNKGRPALRRASTLFSFEFWRQACFQTNLKVTAGNWEVRGSVVPLMIAKRSPEVTWKMCSVQSMMEAVTTSLASGDTATKSGVQPSSSSSSPSALGGGFSCT